MRRALARLRAALFAVRGIRLSELSVALADCPSCNRRRVMVKLRNYEMAVRCTACHASAATLSMISVLRNEVPDLRGKAVYELSARGPLVEYLKRRAARLTCSEFFDDIEPGARRGGKQCQDVQRLTYPDESFDLCTSTEVLEHVPDDAAAFRELRRVLKPGGALVFIVPLSAGATLERARLTPTGIEHITEPEYHGDPIGGSGRILAFRTYGADIVDRLRVAGLESRIVTPDAPTPWGYARSVIVAHKPN
jgi:SAM-dependent methyltransferase